MSSVLICSSPAHGHVSPLVAVAEGLVASGHRVRFLTGERFREAVEASGATFLPLPADGDFDDRRVAEDYPEREGLTGLALMRFDFIRIFGDRMPGQFRAVAAALAAEDVDAVVTEPLFLGAVPLVLQSRLSRPRVVVCGIFPLMLPGRGLAPFGAGLAPRFGWLGALRNKLLTLVLERALLASVQRAAQASLRSLGSPPLPSFISNWPALADSFVQFSVPEFEYPRPDRPASLQFVGPIARPTTAQDRPEWWSDVEEADRVVLITQGTVANQSADHLINPAIAGLADHRNVLMIITTGGADESMISDHLPDNARVAPFLPYDDLLPLVDVMVTNGGYGGVHFALRHGVPLVVAGATEDKVEVGARVAWTGVGVNLKTNRPTPEMISRAVRDVLADPSYRRASARVGQAIKKSPGVAGVVDLVTGR